MTVVLCGGANCITDSGATTYKINRLDKWEEITLYYFLLAYTGILNISGFGLWSVGRSNIRLLLKKMFLSIDPQFRSM